MDSLGLDILAAELASDCVVAAGAAGKARNWLQQQHPGRLEAAAFEVARFYNVVERILERVCVAFENHFEKRGDYHEKLLQRLALELPGIRPAFIPQPSLPQLREIKGFRHVVRHAYDLELAEEKLNTVLAAAESTAAALPGWCAAFARAVRAEQGW